MKIEIAKPGKMTESGSSLLRLMQTTDIPVLDLLVRESVQNSLDAVSEGSKNVNVDFTVGQFKSGKLCAELSGADKNLLKTYPADKDCSFIEIRDSNTVGLTGPLSHRDVDSTGEYGNLIKLVYEISKPQQNEGAGGSWGLGKTIYFRVGIGLVIYYSRIRVGNRFQSRLAACMVENENKKTFVDYGTGLKRGIAWWGRDAGFGDGSTVPVESEKDIAAFLRIFGLTPFDNDNTGTAVIIPFIDEEKLLKSTVAKLDNHNKRPFWTKSLSDYLTVAIQRWYAPRLCNSRYKYGAFLKASVNGMQETYDNMLPLFKVVHDMYLLSDGYTLEYDAILFGKDAVIHTEQIQKYKSLKNTTIAGMFVFCKLTSADLLMTAPNNNKSPYQQIDNSVFENDSNPPILLFTRKPGMIVGYNVSDRSAASKAGEFIIGFFIANSGAMMSDGFCNEDGKPLSLEEYLRSGEKADHADWFDVEINGDNPRVVKNIKDKVKDIIQKEYRETTTELREVERTGLSYTLADLLLPSTGFGKKPAGSAPSKHTEPNPSKKKNSYIRFTGTPAYEEDSIVIDYEMYLNGRDYEIDLSVQTDSGSITANDWENEDGVGTAFPLEIAEFSISSVNNPKEKGRFHSCNRLIHEGQTYSQDPINHFSMTLLKSIKYNVASKIKFSVMTTPPLVFIGKIKFNAKHADIRCDINLKEV